MAKPITFPKICDGVWANAETGVTIMRGSRFEDGAKWYRTYRTNQYGNLVPMSSGGADLKTERRIALHTAMRVQDEVEQAHADALRENETRRAFPVGSRVESVSTSSIGGHIAAVNDHRITVEWADETDREQSTSATDVLDAAVFSQHWRLVSEPIALTESEQDAARTRICLRTDGPHVVHMRAVNDDCRDENAGRCPTCGEHLPEIERGTLGHIPGEGCEDDAPKRQFCRKGIHPCTPAVTLSFERYDDLQGRLHWCAEHARDADAYYPNSLEYAAAFDAARREDDERGTVGTSDDGPTSEPSDTTPRDLQPMHYGDEYLLPVCETSGNGAVLSVTFTPDHVDCPVCLAWMKNHPHPRVTAPADLNDDQAWQQYIAELPTPTTDQYTAVIAEFGDPYADRIAECRQHFIDSARAIRAGRAAGTLTPESYHRYRGAMRVARECITAYRGMTQAWARRMADELSNA